MIKSKQNTELWFFANLHVGLSFPACTNETEFLIKRILGICKEIKEHKSCNNIPTKSYYETVVRHMSAKSVARVVYGVTHGPKLHQVSISTFQPFTYYSS